MRVIREHHVILPLDVLCDQKNNMLIVVTPFCDGGELLESLDHEHFEEERVKVLFEQLLFPGLATLQKARIFHQNITILNIRIISNEVAILFDFGYAMIIPHSADDRRFLIPYPRRFGELHYHSPELTNRSIVCDGPAGDLRAVGVHYGVLRETMGAHPTYQQNGRFMIFLRNHKSFNRKK